ncbi:DJ-1/PfpI family protein [Bremerella sp. JC817]|uniref:DJ-1/PfpI family protein n=1 Tax=Bremerella sp. JC817 TaxID=3231756 RepID=UPI0034590E24
MSRFPLFSSRKRPSKPNRQRRVGRSMQNLEDRCLMAGDLAIASMPIESEYVETSSFTANTTSDWDFEPVGDLEIESGEAFETRLTISGDLDPSAVIFTATIVPTLEQELDARYDLVESDDYHTNCLGQNARWMRSANGGWFYIMPEGDFFQWRGSFENSRLLGSFDSDHYDNPDLLTEPEAVPADVAIEGDTLIVRTDADYTGSFQIEVGATDGSRSIYQTINSFVLKTTPDDPGPDDDNPGDDPTTPQEPMPVLMVIANQDFYFQEYADTRASLEAQGLEVVVAAATTETATPHANSGQGNSSGQVVPDLTLFEVDADDYSAIVFVGGWGSSQYQYAFEGTYNNGSYNGEEVLKQTVNDLINDFVEQDKYVTAICHGVSVLAWARVDGASLLEGRTVSSYSGNAPNSNQSFYTTRDQIEYNGATMVASGSLGDPTTATDDVYVDGRIITAENWDSATMFGEVIADLVSDPDYIDQVFADWD